MSMGQGVRPIEPGALLKLIEKQLQEGGTPSGSNIPGAGLGDRAFLSLWSDKMHLRSPRAKQFVAIRPNRFPVWQTIIQGAGSPVYGFQGQETATGFTTVVSLSCFTQINADVEMRSSQMVTEETLGIVSFVMKVIAAIQFFNPGDPDNGYYLREPMRMTDGGFGLNTMEVGNAWWVQAPLDIECKFTAKWGS